MRLLSIAILAAGCLSAQPTAIGVVSWDNSVASTSGTSAPTTACAFPQFYQQTSNSHLWACHVGGVAWADLTSGQLSFVTQTFDYYIDTVNGNDANAGTSSGAAWKTATNLPSPFPANKKLGLAANSVLHAELDFANSGDTVGAYGTGAMPLIDASDPACSTGAGVNCAGWSAQGTANVYQITLTIIYGVPSDPDWYTSVWENGTRFAIAHSIASVGTTASSYYATRVSGNTFTVYIHTSDGSNPTSNGKTYEYAARQYALDAAGQSITVSGVRCRRSINANGSINLGRGSTMTDGTAEEGTKHNLFHSAGCKFVNVGTIGSYYENLGSTQWILFDSPPFVGLGADYYACWASNSGLQDNTPPGWYAHSSSLSDPPFDHITYTNCTGSLQGTDASTVTVQGSYSTTEITLFGQGIALTIRDSQVTYDANSIYGVGSLANDPANNTITIASSHLTATQANASAVGCRYSGCVITLNGDTITATPSNNSLGGLGTGTNTAGSSFSMHNTIVNVSHYGAGAAYFASPNFSFDNNTYQGYNSNEFGIVNGASKTYAQWKALGYDAHSTP